MNNTHDVHATSWHSPANGHSDFPIQNLPFAVFRKRAGSDAWRGGVAIGDAIVDLAALEASALLKGAAAEAVAACCAPVLDALLELGPQAWTALRAGLFDALHADAPTDVIETMGKTLVPMSDVEYKVPTSVGDYSDFYTSLHHAVNIGRLFGIDKPSPNFYTMPIAYHGRSSTVGVSGGEVRRPMGQIRTGGPDSAPVFEACRKLDYEMELGVFIGPGTSQGSRIALQDADAHMFGVCLLNDWSARDIQAFEMAPLGPFNAKNFATSISPWIVTLEALEPFRVPLDRGEEGRTHPWLPNLSDPATLARAGFDIGLQVFLETTEDRESKRAPVRLSSTSFRHQYWTLAQMLAHHTEGGCAMRSGDLIGSGTISGPSPSEAGAMMELTSDGAKPFTVGGGESRTFLQDGDAIVMRGRCARAGYAAIGFGECRGTIAPAFPE